MESCLIHRESENRPTEQPTDQLTGLGLDASKNFIPSLILFPTDTRGTLTNIYPGGDIKEILW